MCDMINVNTEIIGIKVSLSFPSPSPSLSKFLPYNLPLGADALVSFIYKIANHPLVWTLLRSSSIKPLLTCRVGQVPCYAVSYQPYFSFITSI